MRDNLYFCFGRSGN